MQFRAWLDRADDELLPEVLGFLQREKTQQQRSKEQ
jgi:hypothetical protein